jgi:DNA-3-methyladenine glycosylase II
VARLVEKLPGLHQVRFASLAEGAVFFALSQRSTQQLAAERKARIAAELGPRLRVDGVTHVAFPALSDLLRLGVHDLVPFAGNRQRAQRLAQVLDGVAALDEERLYTEPYEEALATLLAVPGIGTFTAHALLMRVFGRPDDVPLEHPNFAAVTTRVYGPGAEPSPAELRDRYGPTIGWQSYFCRLALE